VLHYGNLGHITITRKKDGSDIHIQDYSIRNQKITCTIFVSFKKNEVFTLFLSQNKNLDIHIQNKEQIEKNKYRYTFASKDNNLEDFFRNDILKGDGLKKITTRHLSLFHLRNARKKVIAIDTNKFHFVITSQKISIWGPYIFPIKEICYCKHPKGSIKLVVVDIERSAPNEVNTILIPTKKSYSLIKAFQETYTLDYRSEEEQSQDILLQATNNENVAEKVRVLMRHQNPQNTMQAVKMMMDFLNYDFSTVLQHLTFLEKQKDKALLEISNISILYTYTKKINPDIDFPYLEIYREVYQSKTLITSLSQSWKEDNPNNNFHTLIATNIQEISKPLHDLLFQTKS